MTTRITISGRSKRRVALFAALAFAALTIASGAFEAAAYATRGARVGAPSVDADERAGGAARSALDLASFTVTTLREESRNGRGPQSMVLETVRYEVRTTPSAVEFAPRVVTTTRPRGDAEAEFRDVAAREEESNARALVEWAAARDVPREPFAADADVLARGLAGELRAARGGSSYRPTTVACGWQGSGLSNCDAVNDVLETAERLREAARA